MNFTPVGLAPEQAHQLSARTIFSVKEIHSLYKRFKELDVSGNNVLEYEVSGTKPNQKKTPKRVSFFLLLF